MATLDQISEFYVAEKTRGLGASLSGTGLTQDPASVVSLLGAHRIRLPWELQATGVQVLCHTGNWAWTRTSVLFPAVLSHMGYCAVNAASAPSLSCSFPWSPA